MSDFIREVSFDYIVGANGSMLSGGQKQKIALARALLLDRPIIVLDEATSNADSYSEDQIASLIHKRMSNKTIIVITHRGELLQVMDSIVLMTDGILKEFKDYQDLSKEAFFINSIEK